MKKVMLERGLRQARSYATKIMLQEKLQDPEFRTQFIRARLEKKGLEMEE
jgi:glutamine amidotransferase PdxT